MEEILKRLFEAVDLGKINKDSPYPPNLKGMDGSYELTLSALESGVNPKYILENTLIPAMGSVGKKFSENKIYVPQMLMSAKAMAAAMVLLKPFFDSGEIITKGLFIIGTVSGDLHDIGKNLVSMIIEGAGWQVIDLGVDVSANKFLEAIETNNGAVVGLSALLTTTMENMKETVVVIKRKHPETKVLVGGAPVTKEFSNMIGADFYSPDPHGVVNFLKQITMINSFLP